MVKYSPVILKFELLSQGFIITEEAKECLAQFSVKEDVNIGAVGKHAFDIILNDGKTYVGVPVGAIVSDHVVKDTPFRLEYKNEEFIITKKNAVLGDDGKWKCIDSHEDGIPIMKVTVFPRPDYYDLRTSRGVPMKTLMSMQGDFGGSTISAKCYFWGHYNSGYTGQGCRYCAIDVNLEAGRDVETKTPEDFVETIREARKYKYFRHGPAFAGGTFPPPDRGAQIHAKFIKIIKEEFPDNWIRLSLSPPESEKYIDMVFEAGVDLLTFNYEIYDPHLFKTICPAKWRDVEGGRLGHEHYDRMLTYIVKNYGKNRAYSNLIVGLEPLESTVAGIEHLASMGVIPCIFVFVPCKGTQLENHPAPSPVDLIYIYQKLKEITEKYGLDSNCAGCQRMMVNTKFFDGIISLMPPISEHDLKTAGLPTEPLYKPYNRSSQ